eukprot:gene2745-4153_t
MSEKVEYLYKILVVGDIGAGKTSIVKRYVHQFFSTTYKSTIGVDFALKVLEPDDHTTIRLQLWDIAGQERFGNMTRVYYKEAVGAIVVFDVTRTTTFEAVKKWKNDIDRKVFLPDDTKIPCVLLANKCDLRDQISEGLSNEDMDQFVMQHEFAGWFETSAKENVGIDKGIEFLVGKIRENHVDTTQEKKKG